jgi:hypothetical protein
LRLILEQVQVRANKRARRGVFSRWIWRWKIRLESSHMQRAHYNISCPTMKGADNSHCPFLVREMFQSSSGSATTTEGQMTEVQRQLLQSTLDLFAHCRCIVFVFVCSCIICCLCGVAQRTSVWRTSTPRPRRSKATCGGSKRCVGYPRCNSPRITAEPSCCSDTSRAGCVATASWLAGVVAGLRCWPLRPVPRA